MKRPFMTLSLTLLTMMAVSLPALAINFQLEASGPIALTGTACPAGTSVDTQCYSIAGSLSGPNKKTVGVIAFEGTLQASSVPTSTKSGTCYAVFNSSNETATVGTTVVNINLIGQACIKTSSKGVITESLVSGKWIGIESLQSGTGTESWTITPTDDLSNTAPLAGTGKLKIQGILDN
jgi:hypothetical protein